MVLLHFLQQNAQHRVTQQCPNQPLSVEQDPIISHFKGQSIMEWLGQKRFPLYLQICPEDGNINEIPKFKLHEPNKCQRPVT